MSLQEILLVAISVLLLVMIYLNCVGLRQMRGDSARWNLPGNMVGLLEGSELPRRRPSLVRQIPTARRKVLPLSTTSARGHGVDVLVFDSEKNSFRRVGLVSPDGKDVAEPEGDGIHLTKGKLYRLIARPQGAAFSPERVIIGGVPGDWNVHDISVGHRSQFVQAGIVPGAVFAASAIDSLLSMDTVQTAMDFSIDVSYHGPNLAEPFYGTVMGTEAYTLLGGAN